MQLGVTFFNPPFFLFEMMVQKAFIFPAEVGKSSEEEDSGECVESDGSTQQYLYIFTGCRFKYLKINSCLVFQ